MFLTKTKSKPPPISMFSLQTFKFSWTVVKFEECHTSCLRHSPNMFKSYPIVDHLEMKCKEVTGHGVYLFFFMIHKKYLPTLMFINVGFHYYNI